MIEFLIGVAALVGYRALTHHPTLPYTVVVPMPPPSTESERRSALLLAEMRADYLSGNYHRRKAEQEKRHRASHFPWNNQTSSCERCGKSARELFASPYGVWPRCDGHIGETTHE